MLTLRKQQTKSAVPSKNAACANMIHNIYFHLTFNFTISGQPTRMLKGSMYICFIL